MTTSSAGTATAPAAPFRVFVYALAREWVVWEFYCADCAAKIRGWARERRQAVMQRCKGCGRVGETSEPMPAAKVATKIPAAVVAAREAKQAKGDARRAAVASDVQRAEEKIRELNQARDRMRSDPRMARLAELRAKGKSLSEAIEQIDKENTHGK